MQYELKPASPKAMAKVESHEDTVGVEEPNADSRVKYPYAQMLIGECFTVPIDQCNEGSLRSGSNAYGRLSGKKFTAIKHRDLSLIEVARVG